MDREFRSQITSFLSSISGSAAHVKNDTTSFPICTRIMEDTQFSNTLKKMQLQLRSTQVAIRVDENPPEPLLQAYHLHTQVHHQ